MSFLWRMSAVITTIRCLRRFAFKSRYRRKRYIPVFPVFSPEPSLASFRSVNFGSFTANARYWERMPQGRVVGRRGQGDNP